jgi:hypothetical protein
MKWTWILPLAVVSLAACGSGPEPMPEPTETEKEAIWSAMGGDEVTRLGAMFLDHLENGWIAQARDNLCNDAFREAISFEQLEATAARLKERLGEPGKATMTSFKTDARGAGVLGQAAFEVEFAKGNADVLVSARKLQGQDWLLEGFGVRSPLFK